MRSKIFSKRVALMIVFSGFFFFELLILYFIPKSAIRSGSASIVESTAVVSLNREQTSAGLPVRLKIPEIDVDAAIEHIGLTPDGAMDTPKGPAEVAWFNLGPHPGENGSAVIAGHYGWKNNTPAVFDNLHKLRKSDKISIEDEKGAIITFVVREIRIYGKDEAAPDVFGSNDGKAHLNLVTCAGVWNKPEKTRSDRLIVFADKEEAE
jgi:LPXTG-site transpeptidase (sortase) family protein